MPVVLVTETVALLVSGEAAAPHGEGKVVLDSCVVYGHQGEKKCVIVGKV